MLCRMSEDMLPVIRRLWMECFGDDEEYVDFYFREYRDGRTTWILREEERIAGMVSELDCGLVRHGIMHPVKYQYAGGIFPKLRGRGLFPDMMRRLRAEAEERDEPVIFEPGPGLFEYYRRMGYQDRFFVKEYAFEAAGYETAGKVRAFHLRRADPADYQQARDAFFAGDGYAAWGLSHISYAIAESELAGGGAFYTGEEATHIALIGGMESGVLRVKEAIIPDECLVEEISWLAAAFACNRVVVRLPVWSTLRGTIKEFGVGFGPHLEEMERPYLNLTLD